MKGDRRRSSSKNGESGLSLTHRGSSQALDARAALLWVRQADSYATITRILDGR
jgi:hypothetical protein